MSRYIDADVAKKAICYTCSIHQNGGKCKGCDAVKAIDETSIADVVEVKRGRWVEEPSTYISATGFVCSVCGERSPDGAEYPYCPWCGAKMDEVTDGK